MKYLRDKTVLITGAGFSAPAKLPIQDKILEEMTAAPVTDFMTADPSMESIKFLIAYIKVTTYLLKEYSDNIVLEYEQEFEDLTNSFQADKRVLDVLKFVQSKYGQEAQIKDFNINEVLNDVANNFILEKEKYCVKLLGLKERLRTVLESKRIGISLEDVFTAFDKSIAMRENTKNYTYVQMDSLQHSILRLFTYYFSKKTNEHTYTNGDYEEVIRFLKKNNNTAIITTNWDVLLEKYILNGNMSYNYNFNSEYVIYNDIKTQIERNEKSNAINLIKIHGSINWFRCLRCGTLQVYNVDECGQYLFDDLKEEKCNLCGQVAYGSRVQLKPEIITPTMFKSINSQLYNNLWQNAVYELQNASRVIFCGYSLPIADFEFRYLLKQNINPKTKIDIVLYLNDDPTRLPEGNVAKGLLPERRFKDLFSSNECNFHYNGFGEYFKNINI